MNKLIEFMGLYIATYLCLFGLMGLWLLLSMCGGSAPEQLIATLVELRESYYVFKAIIPATILAWLLYKSN